MIPNYTLYGDRNDELFPDILHCESIAARSGKHNWKIAPHRHHALHQFFWLSSGGGTISIDGKSHSLDPPVIITLPALAVHGFEFIRNTKGWVVTIPVMVLEDTLRQAAEIQERLSVPCLLPGESNQQVYFEQISDEHQATEPGRQQKLVHLAGLLAVDIGRRIPSISPTQTSGISRQQSILQHFLALLEEHYRSLHSVAGYADLLNITPPHLTRICRQVTGKSASELIQGRLVLEAKRSLVYSRMPVSELAYSLGYDDPAHFSKFFQRNTGLSPPHFRQYADQEEP